MDERKVLVSANGLGRIAIVRRADGLFCLYERWLWSVAQQRYFNVSPVRDRRWTDGDFEPADLYDDLTQPSQGLFGTIEEAEREARSLPNFAEAIEYRR